MRSIGCGAAAGPLPRTAVGLTEREVITIAVIAERMGLDAETAILGYLRRNRCALFPQLPDRLRDNRRRHALGEAIHPLRRHVLGWLLALLPPGERALCLMDSLPVPAVDYHHARGEHAWQGWPTYGNHTTKKQTSYGCTLHLVTMADWVLGDCLLAPVHPTDGPCTAQLLRNTYHLLVVGNNGYIAVPLPVALVSERDSILLTPKRANQQAHVPKELMALITYFRQMIETINSQLADHFKVETNKAKRMNGLLHGSMLSWPHTH
jgi:hypothetical protein